MDKVNNVGSASQVGRSLSPIETAILILIGVFIVIRIMRKFLNRISSKAGEDVKTESVEEKQNYHWVYCDGKLMRVKTAPDGQDSDTTSNRVGERSSSSSTSSTDGEEFKDFEVGDVVTDKSENDPFVYVIQAIEETTSQCTLYDGIEIHPGKPLNMMEKMKTAPDEVAINEGKVYRLTDNICALTSSYVNKDYKVNEEILVKEDLKKGFVKSNRGFIFPKKMLIPLNP